MVEENKNKKKVSPKKKRYLSALLFLVFVVGILNLSLPKASAAQETPSWKKTLNFIYKYSPFSAQQYQTQEWAAQMTADQSGGTKTKADVLKEMGLESYSIASPFILAFNGLLYAVLWAVSKLLIVAAFLLDRAASTELFSLILNSSAIVKGWRMIRDICNLFFILVLLFSAFCTIFQVSKWNLKTILLTLVIVALLINFSFPIARFIIDAANVTMYFLLNQLFNPGSNQDTIISTQLGAITGVQQTLLNVDITSSSSLTGQLILSIIFIFILMATMMVIAITLLARIVILAILVMFSAGGLVATIFPSTQNISKQWWDNLFKYAFIGPILVFFMYFAVMLMNSIAPDPVSMDPNSKSFLATAIRFAIPVTILWIGLAMSQKMGAIGASYATKKLAQGGNWAKSLPWRGTKAAARATGIPGGAKQGWDNFRKTGKLFGTKIKGFGGTNARERREAQFGGAMSYGAKGWKAGGTNMDRKRAQEQADEYKKLNKNGSDAATDLEKANDPVSGNKVDAMANAIYMEEKGLLTDIGRFEEALKAFKGDSGMQAKIIDKANKNIIGGDPTKTVAQNANDYKNTRDIIHATDPNLVKALDKKLTDEGHAKIMIDYDMTLAPTLKTAATAFGDRLGKLSPQDFAKQKGLDPVTNSHFEDYLILNTSDGFRESVGRFLNRTDRSNWESKGFL